MRYTAEELVRQQMMNQYIGGCAPYPPTSPLNPYSMKAQRGHSTALSQIPEMSAREVLEQEKESVMSLPKEKRPQGWKAAIIWIGAAMVCWKIWQNRDELVVKAEELGKELFDKLNLTPKEEVK